MFPLPLSLSWLLQGRKLCQEPREPNISRLSGGDRELLGARRDHHSRVSPSLVCAMEVSGAPREQQWERC